MKTASLDYVPQCRLNRDACWRLVVWVTKENAVMYIEDVLECASYDTLRRLADKRGFRMPTLLRVIKTIPPTSLAEGFDGEEPQFHGLRVEPTKISWCSGLAFDRTEVVL